jgi:hypothetical protein
MRSKPRSTLLVTLLVACTGCLEATTVASFAGTRTPVMLGVRDRVGASSTPLPFTKTKEFETESHWEQRQGSSSNGVTRTDYIATEETGPGKLSYDAKEAAGTDPSVDIRLTMVKARSYAAWGGLRSKSFVVIEGDVGTVGGGK